MSPWMNKLAMIILQNNCPELWMLDLDGVTPTLESIYARLLSWLILLQEDGQQHPQQQQRNMFLKFDNCCGIRFGSLWYNIHTNVLFHFHPVIHPKVSKILEQSLMVFGVTVDIEIVW